MNNDQPTKFYIQWHVTDRCNLHCKHCYVEDKNNDLNKICDIIQNSRFKEFIKSCMLSNFQIDYRLFTYLKKDFWKEFINDSSNNIINNIDNLLDKTKNTQNEINEIICKIDKTKKIIEL